MNIRFHLIHLVLVSLMYLGFPDTMRAHCKRVLFRRSISVSQKSQGERSTMPTRKLSSLGAMVKKKRGSAKLRETAKAIGIGPATLMRVESGRVPDVSTFGKICQWLQV